MIGTETRQRALAGWQRGTESVLIRLVCILTSKALSQGRITKDTVWNCAGITLCFVSAVYAHVISTRCTVLSLTSYTSCPGKEVLRITRITGSDITLTI